MNMRRVKRNYRQAALVLGLMLIAGWVGAKPAIKGGCYYANVHYAVGDTVLMANKVKRICVQDQRTGYRWAPIADAKYSTLTPPDTSASSGAFTPLFKVDALAVKSQSRKQAVGETPILADVAARHNQEYIRFFKYIMGQSDMYMFTLALNHVSPKIYQNLRDTVAFFQRKLTNQLLLKLISQQKDGLRNPLSQLATGSNALLLHLDNDKTVPFFTFIRLYHGQPFVRDCLIPLVRSGAVSLKQLHQAWNVFEVLGEPDNYDGTHFSHATVLSCVLRANEWAHLWSREQHHHIVQRYRDVRLLQVANQATDNHSIPTKQAFAVNTIRAHVINRLQKIAKKAIVKRPTGFASATTLTPTTPIYAHSASKETRTSKQNHNVMIVPPPTLHSESGGIDRNLNAARRLPRQTAAPSKPTTGEKVHV